MRIHQRALSGRTWLAAACLVSWPLFASQFTHTPTASELLDHFAQAQQRLKSFVADYEVRRHDEILSSPRWSGNHHIVGETRCDGHRVSERHRLWGQIGRGVSFTKDKPNYRSRLVNDQFRCQYDQTPPDAGILIIKSTRSAKPPPNLAEALDGCASALALALGIMPHDSKRIDVRLRELPTIHLRGKTEPAGWVPSPCHVLEAKTPQGHYTLWLDPTHGYHLAKGILRRGPGDRRGGWTLKADESDVSVVDKVRFAKCDGLWVPVEVAGSLDNTFVGGHRTRMQFHLQITRFILKPDHEALRSFVPDDVRNGAQVFHSGGHHRWQDGRVVDKTGQVILDLRGGQSQTHR